MNIDNIITEAINSFVNEVVLLEKKKKSKKDKKKKTKKKSQDLRKKGKKLKNGLRADFDSKKDRETNPNLNNQDNEDLANVVDSDIIDVAALAQKIYPDHTPEGAQSQLRKKIKGIKNDNGSKYRLKKKEAFKIRRELAKELN